MAAPNIISVGLITAGTQTIAATTGGATLLSNGSTTGYLVKVNMVMIANISAYANDITLNLVRTVTTAGPPASTTGTYALAYTVTVPEKSTLILIGKDTTIYLQEGDSLQVIASNNSTLQATCSYEIITQATTLP
jgi:hypothetical protein